MKYFTVKTFYSTTHTLTATHIGQLHFTNYN